jgi:ABC-type cobalamin/Fe3+-siderophores transport system ATPase subunit
MNALAGAVAAAAEPRLKVEQASFAYAATDKSAPKFTLGPVSFEAQHELIAILGPNASGKSTLLGLLAGMHAPLAGRIALDGTDILKLEARVRAQRIALVQQESELLFPLRVWEYVLQGRYPYGRRLRFESQEDCLMAGNALAQVGADALRDRWMDQLSGGEKQRVILARALAQQPLLLLLYCCTKENAFAPERRRKCTTAQRSRKCSKRRWMWKCERAVGRE